MTRSVFRFVPLTIRTDEASEALWAAFCEASGCGWESGPAATAEAADMGALRHAGATGHRRFRRTVTGWADVTG
ncbi:DUF7848 domain-containing protein [Streptomyces koyangensis]